MSKRQYSDEQRAAVMAALLAGQSISEVAEHYHIPEGTIKHWSAVKGSVHGAVDLVEPQKKAQIGDLILAYLRENLLTLRAQQVFFRDKDWLAKQTASELAVLHGVSTDKAIRLLEAIGKPGDGDEAPPGVP